MWKYILYFLLPFILFTELKAQTRITGKITDATTNQPIEFATIALFQLPDSVIKASNVSNEQGAFDLQNLAPGNYYARIEFIGYKPLFVPIQLTKDKKEALQLNTLQLGTSQASLKEVVVATQADMVKNGLDKKVFNLDKNMIGKGGNVTDVLQQVPSVNVDVDGKVSLRGSENVTVLIDGKPSGLTGSGRGAALQNIPADAIESIEVITNPSAKYDPDGMSGIINIVLKKNRQKGTNGNFSIGAGTRNGWGGVTPTVNKYNLGGSINYRNKRLNAFANYNFNYNPRYSFGYIERQNLLTDTTYFLSQNSSGNNLQQTHIARGGLDYFLNPENTLTFSGGVNLSHKKQDDLFAYNYKDEDYQSRYIHLRNTDGTEKQVNYDAALSFRHLFSKPRRELTVDANYSASNSIEDKYFNQSYLDSLLRPSGTPNLLQKNNVFTGFSVTTLQSDYTHPITETSKMEVGVKSISRNIDNNLKSSTLVLSDYVNDSLISNQFVYKENVNSAYINYGQTLGKYSLQGGVRAEQTFTTSTQVTTSAQYHYNYANLFPSVFVNRKLMADQEIQLSYSKRINRPQTQALNPFPDYSDPTTLRIGNPRLKPEYIHSFELAYSINKQKVGFTANAYYRRSNNIIMRVVTVSSAQVSTVSFQNITTSDVYGTDLTGRLNFFKWLNLTVNYNFFQTILNGYTTSTGELNNNALSWFAKVNANIVLPKGWGLQLSGNYNARTVIPQGLLVPRYQTNAGIKKEVLKGKGTITLNMTDVFNTFLFGVSTSGTNFKQSAERKRETQIINLTFSYNFGKGENFQRKKTKAEQQKQDTPQNDGGGF